MSSFLPFTLAIGLWVEARVKANSGPQQTAKLTPEGGGKLGTSARDDVDWNAMEPNNMKEEKFGSHLC